MLNLKHAGTIALLAGALALGSSAGSISASAAPAAAKAVAGQTTFTDGNLLEVQGRRDGRHWRGGGRRGGNWGGRHRGRGYYNNNGAWIGLGVAGALIAGGLANEYYDDEPEYSSYSYSGGGSGSGAMRRCARTFKSFEWDTGLYTTYDGDKRPCPYLR